MKLLQTAVHEIESAAELESIINENENVMVCSRWQKTATLRFPAWCIAILTERNNFV